MPFANTPKENRRDLRESCRGPAKTFGGQLRGQNSVLRGQARVQSLGPRALRQKFQGTSGHAAGDANGGKHLLFGQAQEFRRGYSRAKNAAGRSGMEAQFVMIFRLQRHCQARGDFVSGDDGRTQIGRKSISG